ncbi:tRNA lysidine(34) synthetase TilS [Candidatus Omnitrophota bacterium]
MDKRLLEQVLRTIRSYEMIDPGETVLVCVSGGPDSVFLLLAMMKLRRKLKIKVCACNLDHGLRAKESAGDSRFAIGLARKLGIEILHKKIKLKGVRSERISTEEIARKERYNFYAEAAKKTGARTIATGHTLDDQAETVLMRIIKGSSLKGAAGIPPVRGFGSSRIIRPLIEIQKKDIAGWIKREKIPFRADSTNETDLYFRNIVRRKIIPYLERHNPRLKRSLFNFAQHVREDLDFISSAKANAAPKSSKRDGRIEIPLKDIAIQPKALQKEILRDALKEAGGLIKKLTYRHWKDAEVLIRQKKKGALMDLPGGVRLKRTERFLQLYRLNS